MWNKKFKICERTEAKGLLSSVRIKTLLSKTQLLHVLF